jgi:hypothetical protein
VGVNVRASGHDLRKVKSGFRKRSCPYESVSSSNPAAGAMTGNGPSHGPRSFEIARTIGRMDAIQSLKTMAGSPDAGTAKAFAISVSQSCDGFCVLASLLS